MNYAMRWKWEKRDSRLLFALALAGQALALAIGLWLEHQLLVAMAADASLANQLHGTAPAVQPRTAEYSTTIKITAFFWIGCSQAAIAYLIMSRWYSSRLQKENADARVFAQQNHDLLRTRDAVIFGLAKLAESRDPDTGQHLERIALYSTRLADAMRRQPRFATEISASFMRLLGVSSALHDIGKVGVEDAILLKPGQLTDGERKKIQQHTLFGSRCIEQIENRLGQSNFLSMAREIALYHHERWDGTGYPCGLKGAEIPLAARIIAVADVYDALSVRRVYKEPYSHERCVAIIREGAGTQFDPHIVEVFLQIEGEFRRFARELSDLSYSENEAEDVPPQKLTPEQVELLERVITVEKFCARDAHLVDAMRSSTSRMESAL